MRTMNAAVLERDMFAPQQPPRHALGARAGDPGACAADHGAAFSVNWKASEPEGVVAELWSALPQTAAPRADARPSRSRRRRWSSRSRRRPSPSPSRRRRRAPTRRSRSSAPRARRRAARKPSASRRRARPSCASAKTRSAKRPSALEAKRSSAERQRAAEQAEKKKLAEQAKKDEARQAAIREANLRRMMSQAGTSDDPAAAGNAARTSGPSASYAGRIKARIKPNIVLTATLAGNPAATVEVQGRARRHDRRQEAGDEQRLAGVGRDRAARDRQDRGAAEGRRRPRAADDHHRVPAERLDERAAALRPSAGSGLENDAADVGDALRLCVLSESAPIATPTIGGTTVRALVA